MDENAPFLNTYSLLTEDPTIAVGECAHNYWIPHRHDGKGGERAFKIFGNPLINNMHIWIY
jgi:hypothetical protein